MRAASTAARSRETNWLLSELPSEPSASCHRPAALAPIAGVSAPRSISSVIISAR